MKACIFCPMRKNSRQRVVTCKGKAPYNGISVLLGRLVPSSCGVDLWGRSSQSEAPSPTCWVVAESEAQRAEPQACRRRRMRSALFSFIQHSMLSVRLWWIGRSMLTVRLWWIRCSSFFSNLPQPPRKNKFFFIGWLSAIKMG